MKYLITGGGFGNKGAESMLYTVISELKNRDSSAQIVVSCVHGLDRVNLARLDHVCVVSENSKSRKILLNRFRYLLYKCFYPFICLKRKYLLVQEYLSCDVILDISGYALSSQFGDVPNKRFMEMLQIANLYHKEIYLLPQSFGPFNFSRGTAQVIKLLSGVKKIFCREKDGYQLLRSCGLSNIVLANDIVLEAVNDYADVSSDEFDIKRLHIEDFDKRILIIPNTRVFERTDQDRLYDIYFEIIDYLLDHEYTVFISYYDLNDINICRTLKSHFPDNNVIFIQEYLSCINFSKLLEKFTLVISSRFHSIVHAYRYYIPCLVIGWAVKYQELTASVQQENYLFDVRDGLVSDAILLKLQVLLDNLDVEKDKIKSNVLRIQENSSFKLLWECLSDK